MFRSEADRTDTGDRVESISTTADDVQAIVKMQNLSEISAGDCVALHTGQGNSWSNDRYKSMNADQREAARDLFAEGEPGFSLSACEYLASRDIGPHHRRRDHGRSPSCVVLRGELANSRKMISPILRPISLPSTSALRKWMPPQTRALSTSSV